MSTLKQRAIQLFHLPQLDIYFNGNLITDLTRTITESNILENDILLVRQSATTTSTTPLTGMGGGSDRAELVRQQIMQNPSMRAQITAQNPIMGRALDNPAQFKQLFTAMEQMMASQSSQPIGQSSSDDFMDIESQKRIEEEIKKANIQQNLENAMEYNPESFGRVVMLYINISVNNVPIKGAQATIMSPSLAQKCNIMHLIDERFSGIAHGVGTAKILGRIHSAPLKIGNLFFNGSFTVMENKGVEFLLGLDMLKRHQAIIDLKENVLRIGDEKVQFLAEHEIPASDRFENQQSPSTTQPSSLAQPNVPSTTVASTSAQSKYPESAIQSLVGLGVSREEAIGALDLCGGNADVAASMLFQ